jgi:serine/threonine protein kinase/Tol biopolymer transport system component
MSLKAGIQFGPYEILSLLGAGGMGEVYRARDTKLNREVALKVLPEAFARDAERMARFQREAQVLASLNHPNIAAIYGLEESGGVRALVMELVEGPTLADRIMGPKPLTRRDAGGPPFPQGRGNGQKKASLPSPSGRGWPEGPAEGAAIPLEETLQIARQIAEGLEYAHERGIIHRDLKPANVKVRPDGTVKILDFGLAKAAEGTVASMSPADSPTLTTAATQVGMILGTAAYMSPEQAKGKAVDRRSDIWAFGCVLYEMLTGRRLFQGESASDTLAAVLTKEPDWHRVPPKVLPLLRRCLEKESKRRLRDIGDIGLLLEDTPVPALKSSRLWKAAAGVLVLLLALAIALWKPWRGSTRPIEQPLVRLDLDLGPDVSLGSGIGPAVILSPDGTLLVFVVQGKDGTRRLFTRRLDSPKATPLAKTEGAYVPFFSPDGQWVGFFAAGKLKKTRIDGGEPVSLCDAPAGRGASWGDDGNIIATLDTQAGLSRVPPEGGKAISITELGLGEVSHRWPHVLPGGKAVLFTVGAEYGNYDRGGIAVVSLKDHRTKIVLEHAGTYPQYLPSGHLVYITKGTLFAVPFDLDRLEVRDPATRLQEVSSDPNFGSAQIGFSRSGTIAYRSGRTEGLKTIQWVDGAGKTESLGIEPARYLFPRLSPDGSRLVVRVNQEAGTELWIYDLQRSSKTRLTTGTGLNSWPVWSTDGLYVIFQSAGGMFWTRADGAGKPQQLTGSKTLQFPNSFSPDGTRLAFSELTSGGGAEFRTVPVKSGSGQLRAEEAQLFLKTSTVNAFAAFSPDGRWLAYADAEAESYEVSVRAFPDKGTRVQISNAGGLDPRWSRNGHELFYRTLDQRIMVANYTVKGGTFVADKPRVWFGKPLANTGTAPNFDLAPDGKRFIVLMAAESPEPLETQSHVKIAVNFFDEVRLRVAAQGK